MKSTQRLARGLMVMMVTAGCAGPQTPMPITPPGEAKHAAVVRRPLDTPVLPQPPASARTPTPAPAAALPASALYVCVSEAAGLRTETAIALAPNVLALCRRHPEMGPCQYERDLCRNSGGRVFAADGKEITRQIEDEYDRKVMRVRFRAN